MRRLLPLALAAALFTAAALATPGQAQPPAGPAPTPTNGFVIAPTVPNLPGVPGVPPTPTTERVIPLPGEPDAEPTPAPIYLPSLER